MHGVNSIIPMDLISVAQGLIIYIMYSCVQIDTDMYKHKYTNKYFK